RQRGPGSRLPGPLLFLAARLEFDAGADLQRVVEELAHRAPRGVDAEPRAPERHLHPRPERETVVEVVTALERRAARPGIEVRLGLHRAEVGAAHLELVAVRVFEPAVERVADEVVVLERAQDREPVLAV